jgi:acetoin utilization protein AcuB
MRVDDVMSTPVRTIDGERSSDEAWETMRRYRTRHLVVTARDGRVVGIVSASDLGGRHGEPLRRNRPVADLMTAKVVVATPETTIREAANLMRGHAVSCLPVFAGSRLKGIVTVLDLLELIGRGAERPVAKAERRILKDRGQRPAAKNIGVRSSSPDRRTATSRARRRRGA